GVPGVRAGGPAWMSVARRSAGGARMTQFGRVLTAMVTPFDDTSGSLDLDQARRLAAALLDSGTEGLVVCGTTGEAPTLSNQEKLALLEATAEVAHARGA